MKLTQVKVTALIMIVLFACGLSAYAGMKLEQYRLTENCLRRVTVRGNTELEATVYMRYEDGKLASIFMYNSSIRRYYPMMEVNVVKEAPMMVPTPVRIEREKMTPMRLEKKPVVVKKTPIHRAD